MRRGEVDFHALFSQVYVLLVGLTSGLGIVILGGGDLRFSGPVFVGPRNLVAWVQLIPAWVIWGSLFVVLGVALVLSIGRTWAVHVLRFGTVVYAFLVVSLISSVLTDPVASATGVVAYGSLAVLHAVLSVHLDHEGWEG